MARGDIIAKHVFQDPFTPSVLAVEHWIFEKDDQCLENFESLEIIDVITSFRHFDNFSPGDLPSVLLDGVGLDRSVL